MPCIFSIVLCCHIALAATYYKADFDSTDPGSKELQGGQIDAVTNPFKDSTNNSDKVGRCRVNDGGRRAEYSSPRIATNEKKYVYRWMYYIPADFATAALEWRVLSQWKTWPCEVCSNYAAEICYGCGGIFDEVRGESGKFTVRWRANPDCRTYERPIIMDRWVRFMMDIYWTNTVNGYTKLWIDGTLVSEHTNIKTLFDRFPANNSCNIYWAVGLYGPLTGRAYADVYIDNISITDESTKITEGPARTKQPASLLSAGAGYTHGAGRITFVLDKTIRAGALAVHDMRGRLVRSLTQPTRIGSGALLFMWDGRDNRGKAVPAGAYVVSTGGISAKMVISR